ncbi:MAG: hypothetical protein WCK09_12315 [Bacteroidota bacterium]
MENRIGILASGNFRFDNNFGSISSERERKYGSNLAGTLFSDSAQNCIGILFSLVVPLTWPVYESINDSSFGVEKLH